MPHDSLWFFLIAVNPILQSPDPESQLMAHLSHSGFSPSCQGASTPPLPLVKLTHATWPFSFPVAFEAILEGGSHRQVQGEGHIKSVGFTPASSAAGTWPGMKQLLNICWMKELTNANHPGGYCALKCWSKSCRKTLS